MKAFEDAKFAEWKQRTEQILPTLQKRNVLKELPATPSKRTRPKRRIRSRTPLPKDQNPLMPRYVIDFDPQLNEMMTEARYLEQFDYPLPDSIRHLALSVSERSPSLDLTLRCDRTGGQDEEPINTVENSAEELSSSD